MRSANCAVFAWAYYTVECPPSKRNRPCAAFAAAETQALICTSVVEVGIDVPNATVMTIYDADRFGLAQLHQLRGRVHRGKHPGYCCLFTNKEELPEESRERLDALVKSTDGFELAEVDFRLRGPGDLFGTKQHGLPPLRIADLQKDRELVEEARSAARDVVTADPGLQKPEHAKLRRMVLVRYGKALDLGDVG
ncbi:MAG: helicase-related protein [Pirellulales bacterium]